MLRSLLVLLVTAATLFSAQTTFKVKEAMGVSRVNEPVSGGIAFSKGALSSVSNLALFDGATEIPVQAYPLVKYFDGSIQWALVDFTAAFAGSEERTFTLKTQSSAAAPSPVVTVSRNNSVITINNGVLSVSFDTVNFKGIESLVYGSKTLISGPGCISAFDLVKGTPDTNGPVTKAQFIYLGSLRATYRVEGNLYMGTCGGLGYAYTITVYAGSPRVMVDAALRNSVNSSCGRLAKIARAFAGFNLAFDPAKTIAYDTVAGRPDYMYAFRSDTIRSTRAFEDNSGTGLAVTEKWGGGAYENFLNRTTLTGRKLEMELVQPLDSIPPIFAYGTWQPSYCPGYAEDSVANKDFGKRYVYYLMDYAHLTSQIVLECYNTALSASGLRAKMLAAKHRLVPRQAAADVAASGGLSIGKFGTLEDELACQTKWGWQPSDPTVNGDNYHDSYKPQRMRGGTGFINKPDCAPWMDIESHYDIEMDYLQGWLTQWLRYGNRDFFDLGEAYGKFFDNFYAFRTTGFAWDGQNSYVRGNAKRTSENVPKNNGTYNSLVSTRLDINDWGGCHFFMTGMTDYYCLTGDPDALDACRDVCDVVNVFLGQFGGGAGPVDTSNSNVNLGDRGVNRKLNYWIRYYEITQDASILENLRTYVRGAMKSKKVDPYFWQKSEFYEASWHATPFKQYKLADTLLQYMRANHLGIEQLKDGAHFDQYVIHDSVSGDSWHPYSHPDWQSYWLVDALENWLRMFPNDDDVRDYIIGYSNYITNIKDAYCGLDNYESVLSDFPRKGMYSPVYHRDDTLFLTKWDPAHAQCATAARASDAIQAQSGVHNTWNNSVVLAVQAAGFRNTGFTYFLKQAERIWGYVSGNSPLPGPADEPGKFAQIGEWEFYHNDQLTKVIPLFYEKMFHTDTVPAEAVGNLSVGRLLGNTGLAFQWSAPAGGAVSYQLKISKNKPLADYPDFDYTNFDTTKTPWWYGANVSGEPTPGAAGSPESFSVTGDYPTDSVFYAAVCSRDAAGNLSRLSNVVRIDATTISVESPEEALQPLMLTASPNPFNPAVKLAFFPGNRIMRNVKLSIVAISGQVLDEYRFDAVHPGKGVTIHWKGVNRKGKTAAAGVYMVKVTADGLSLVKKIVMAK